MQRNGPAPDPLTQGAGLYVHIPFCLKKCRYCSFNSIPYDKAVALRYINAVIVESGRIDASLQPETLYIGGGTPTVLPQAGLFALLDAVRQRLKPSPETEATIEANPAALGGLDLGSLRGQGINRVSLGAQSFDRAELDMLGRLHGPDDIAASVMHLRVAGFVNINLDLIYALPGQDMGRWLGNLNRAIGLSPEHISIYDLSFEEGTPFHREYMAGRLAKPPEDLQAEMYLAAVDTLEGSGYKRYEVSNFAKPGYECRHNINYWSCGDYVGLGAGAHSHLSGVRKINMEGVDEYIDTVEKGFSPVASEERPTPEEVEREFIMLSLRMAGGLRLSEYARRFGGDFMVVYGDRVAGFARAGLLEVDETVIRLTRDGVLASSYVISGFF